MDVALRRWRYRVFAATWLGYVGLYFCRKPFYIVKAKLGEELHLGAEMLGLIGALPRGLYRGAVCLGFSETDGPEGVAVRMAVSIARTRLGLPTRRPRSLFHGGKRPRPVVRRGVGTMANWFHRRERAR